MNRTIAPPVSFYILLALIWLPACSQASADAPEVRAELNPQTISIDQPATLQITIQNAQSADISMPEIDGLIFHSQGRSSQIQIVNGAVAASVVYSYLVEPVKAGSYEIPPIRVEAGGTPLHTEPLRFTVTASAGGASKPQPDQTGEPGADKAPAFISFLPEKQTIYRGEVIPAKIKVYFKRGTRVNQLSLPRMLGEGLLIDELSNNPPQTQEVVDHVAYSVLVWDTFVTGVKEGAHELTFELDATVLVPSQKRSAVPGFGSGFFNDDLFGDLFSNYRSTPVQVTSEKTGIEVLPLPDTSRPESFSGAVGRFSLQVGARPIKIDPGEPVTLTMQVSGAGNFASVEAPELSDPGGIKTYPPAAEFSADQSPYRGSKKFQQAIIISDPSSREIPPVIFSYFDPDAKRYKTLFSDPIPITLNPAAADNKPAPPPKLEPSSVPTKSVQSVKSADKTAEPTSPTLSLVPVKLDPGTLVEQIRPPFAKAWFVALLSLCVIGIGGFWGLKIYGAIQQGNEAVAFKKALAAKRKETLFRLDQLNPDAADYPARAREPVGDFLIACRRLDRASLTTADVIDCCGSDSAAAELFRLADGALYGKQQAASVNTRDLHRRIKSFISDCS